MNEVTDILILGSRPAKYFERCHLALKNQLECRLHLVYKSTSSNAPHVINKEIYTTYELFQNLKGFSILRSLFKLQPQIILVSGWSTPLYLILSLIFRLNRRTVICLSDTQFNLHSPKQRLKAYIGSILLRLCFSKFWVSGNRQKKLLTSVNIKESKILLGCYTADASIFNRKKEFSTNGYFLFVGRFIERKGLLTLLEAYAMYRSTSKCPRDLMLVGNGDLKEKAKSIEGVIIKDFTTPNGLRNIYEEATCFILPSYYEPWGVVLHEAALMSLPIICTSVCGAGDAFVSHKSGFVIPPHQKSRLKEALLSFDNASGEELRIMSQHSKIQAERISIETWTQEISQLINK